jgi:D-alanine-D-alanine ligase
MSQSLLRDPRFAIFRDLTVGVVRGGTSAERPISLRSGRAVLNALRRVGVRSVPIDPADAKGFREKVRGVDVLFLALHGNGGEDGVLQATLQRKGIAFTASGAEACRGSFNKLVSKRHFERLGIPTPEYIVVSRKDWKKKTCRFPTPFFVKPLDGGSSQGVFLVEDFPRSAVMIERSVKRYGRLLIEKRIAGREVTAGILVDLKLPVIEVRPKRAFYDYKAKYTKGMTEYIVPAPVPAKVAARVQRLAWKVHRGLGLAGFSRVDFMLDEKFRPYVLEVNSIPGMTELSLLPKAARAAGIGFEELCLRVLRDALMRSRRK